jgi:O-acetylhomoserine (thiol)-lyase
MRDETKCLHAGYTPQNAEPRVLPIIQSTTYVYDSTEEVAAVFDDPMKSLIYSRFGNPTVMAVERKIAGRYWIFMYNIRASGTLIIYSEYLFCRG